MTEEDLIGWVRPMNVKSWLVNLSLQIYSSTRRYGFYPSVLDKGDRLKRAD